MTAAVPTPAPRSCATGRPRAAEHREIHLDTSQGGRLVRCPLVAAQGRVHHMRARDDVRVVHDEPNPGSSSRPAALYPDGEPFPVASHGRYSCPQDMVTLKFTSAVPFAMITPVSPPTFSPNSTTV